MPLSSQSPLTTSAWPEPSQPPESCAVEAVSYIRGFCKEEVEIGNPPTRRSGDGDLLKCFQPRVEMGVRCGCRSAWQFGQLWHVPEGTRRCRCSEGFCPAHPLQPRRRAAGSRGVPAPQSPGLRGMGYVSVFISSCPCNVYFALESTRFLLSCLFVVEQEVDSFMFMHLFFLDSLPL